MFLSRLPRELRDTIYDYCTSENGGYFFDPREGKLRTISGDKIDLTLMYTCKSIAAEMRDVLFRDNTIHFTTSPYPDRYTRDYRHFGHLLRDLYSAKNITLSQAIPFITGAITRKIIESFPHSATLIRHLRTAEAKASKRHEQWGRSVEWGSALSLHRDAVAELLSMVAQNPAFDEAIRRGLLAYGFEFRDGQDVLSLHSIHSEPWCIPTTHEIQAMVQCMPLLLYWEPRERVRQRTKYYVSAASQASGFRARLTPQLRSSIRRLELHELHASIAYPECHARALIPFAVENPKLNIVRRVSLWNNALASQHLRDFEYQRYGHSEGRPPMSDMNATKVTSTLAVWLTEVLALERAGMPHKTFSLVFEGKKDSMQPVFDILVEDASWQDALEQWPGRHIGSVFDPERYKGFGSYFFKELPELMRNIIHDTGSVTFNHCSGRVWDTQKILTMNDGCYNMVDWHRKWESLRSHDVAPSLPYTWYAILEGYIDPQLI
ncbi:unnamed protein product [Alternaria alternata]